MRQLTFVAGDNITKMFPSPLSLSPLQACGAGHSIETVNCCEYSFAASPGWDAVTGLGSPNFNIISNLVINNATAFPNIGAYPAGPVSVSSVPDTYYTTTTDDDGEAQAVRVSALAIAVISFVLAAIALALVAMLFAARKRNSSNQTRGKDPESGAAGSAENPLSNLG